MRYLTKMNMIIILAAFFVNAGSQLKMGKVAAQASMNEYCPVTTSEKANPNIYVDYNGLRIHFCCQNCKRDFLADPDKYIGNLKMASSEELSDDHGHNHDSELDHEGRTLDQAGETSDSSTYDNSPDEHANHDHSTDHGDNPGIISLLGKFHPAVVHFPIALVIMTLIFIGIRFAANSELLDKVAVILMYWAAFFAIIAALLGLARAYGSLFPSYLIEYFEWHRLLGLLSTALTIITAVAGYLWQKKQSHKAMILFIIMIVINAIAIGITGHLGATLVFGPNYFG